MIKVLKNKHNKDNSLIELNLFDNPFYFLRDNKKCDHYSTYIEDFKDGICRFCENLPLIEVNPQKRIKRSGLSFSDIHFYNLKKVFSWKIPNKENYSYTLYKANINVDEIDNIEKLFYNLCRENINKKLLKNLIENYTLNLLIVKLTIENEKIEIYDDVIGFSIYEDNFKYLKIKKLHTDLIQFIDSKIMEVNNIFKVKNPHILSIFINLLTQKNFYQDHLLERLNELIYKKESFFEDKILKKVKEEEYLIEIINYIFPKIQEFKKQIFPDLYVYLVCSSERYKANIGTMIFYFFQNEIQEKIKESKSIEGYISLESIILSRDFYSKLGFFDISNNTFYKNILLELNMSYEEFSVRLLSKMMISPNLAENDLNLEKIKDVIIK